MRSALIGLVMLPLLGGAASASALSDAQLDLVTAGVDLGSFNCPGCSFSTSNSTSNNGVTVSTSTSGVISPPVVNPPGGGGNGGAGGGGGNGGNGGNGGLLGGVGVPPAATAVFNALSAGSVTIH